MSTLLAPNDPYNILHACLWGRSEKESAFIKPETIDVPAEHDLAVIQPSTYNVLDFGPNLCVFPDDRSKMMVREEYPSLWTCIEEDRHTLGREFGGMVVTGHPGIGKSFFLYYYLVKNLLAGQSTALQTDKNSFLLFTDQGVYLVPFTSSTPIYTLQSHLKTIGCKKGVVALVDGSEKNPSPAPVFTDSRFPFYVVHATSPRPSRWKDWTEQRSGTIVVMHPWSWSEMFIGGTNFTKRSLSTKDLFDVFEKYGPCPRVCFDICGDERRTELYNCTFRKDITCSPLFSNAVQAYGFSEDLTNFPETLFIMVPSASRLPLVTIASRHVAHLLARKFGRMGLSPKDYDILLSEPVTRKGAGYMYKACMDNLFSRGQSVILICSPRGSGFSPESLNLYITPPYQRVSTSAMPEITDQVYYILDSPATTYDSYIGGRPEQGFYLFKITSEKDAPIHFRELDELADKIRGEFLPWNEGAQPWNIVFVVPKHMEATFQAQPYEGVGKHEWQEKGYIRQYVAGYDP